MAEYLIAHIGHTTKWLEHITWWRPDSKGYTFCIEKAGLYGEGEARSICQYGDCIAVTKSAAAAISKSTPYYRRTGGELARLYDGGEHVVVPNSKEAWAHLMSHSLKAASKTEKPIPMAPTKARAIYLPTQPKDQP